MNKQEYTEYQETVARYLRGLEFVSTGPCPGCAECGIPEDAENYASEPFFSWRECEICKTYLGGNREPWHMTLDGEIVHGVCCEDCVYYLNYGRLDDGTMQQIEGS